MSYDLSKPLVLAGTVALMSHAATPARAEIAVGAGRSVTLATMSSIDQVCHSLGPVSISVLEQPRGGTLQVSDIRAYPNFNALNTRSHCNTIKLPATRVTYQANGDFLGIDFVTIEAIYPEGGVKRYRFPISVRPVATTLAPVPDAPPPQDDDVKPGPKKVAKAKSAQRHAHQAPSTPAPRPADPQPAAKPQPDRPVYTPI